MIIKQLFQGKDYQQTLRRRLGIFIGLTVLGLLLIALSFTAMLTAALPSFARGFYMGAGSGLTLSGIVLSVKTRRLMKNPAAAQKAQISEQDEREQAIVTKAMTTVFWAIYLVLVPGIFIALPLSMDVFYILCGLLFLMTAVFFCSIQWYQKRM